MSYSKIKSFAKINLALNVIGKSHSLHKIESIISFLDLYDLILIKKITNKNHKIKFKGKFSKNIKNNNTVSMLLKILEQKKLLKMQKFEIIINKNIPPEAGLGGGSMNAASILKFLINKKFIKISNFKIIEISNLIGSDVILGMYSSSLVLKSDNRVNKILDVKTLNALIVKPKFGCSTKNIYSRVKNFSKAKFNNPSKKMFEFGFLKKMKNDLELIALKKYPKLRVIKTFLEKISGTKFVRMTGSGSAIIAYFKSNKVCKQAEKKVKKEFRNFWCKTAKTI